mmetsp:Transcript_2665/g.8288  ORF Transcript_2665/g.8288 Transcript_2665/m.8288 type:complete len:134 (+) Transcript_2665:141-542(+)
MAALRLCALLLVSAAQALHITRQQVLRSVVLAPIALPAFADDDLKGLLGAVVENEEAKQAKKEADAALEEKLSKMSAGERIRYERAEAAKTNKAAADEAMRKIKTLVGDQDAADAKPSEEGIRNPAKWDKASE